jgi:deferrochelatase/peroxidase EfeB
MKAVAVSYVATIPPGAEVAVSAALAAVRAPHFDPEAAEPGCIHFFSAVVLPPDRLNDDGASWLSIEAVVDGLDDEAAVLLSRELEGVLQPVAAAMGTTATDAPAIAAWLEAHRLPLGTGLGRGHGLAFDGTPGMTVSRIRQEARLTDRVRDLLRCPNLPKDSALARMRWVRGKIFEDVALKWALFSEPTQLLAPRRSRGAIALTILLAAARDYLLYLLLFPALVVLAGVLASRWLSTWLGIELGQVYLPPLALSALVALAMTAFVERIRLRRLGLAWLLAPVLVAALVALAVVLPIWDLAPRRLQWADLVPSQPWQPVVRAVATCGFLFGSALIVASPMRLRDKFVGVALLAAFSAAVVWQGWPAHVPWPLSMWLALAGAAVSVVLTLLMLAPVARVMATRLRGPARAALLAGLAIMGIHVWLNPAAIVWVLLLGGLALAFEVLVITAAAAIGYRRMREQEEADRPVDREPDAKAMEAILAHENQRLVVQNHLAAQSIVKPGWHRIALLNIALWVIAKVIAVRSPAGFLGRIGSIHHARWFRIPKTRRLVFLSNYDGSWQSYLEDFIARLRQGLSSVWSNTEGFPRTFRLTAGGASDGSRFKRWARRQQVPSTVWISGYMDLTTSAIRTNAAIRLGLAAARTERDAQRWLVGLGMAVREELARDQISTLVIDGLKKLPHGALLAVRFRDEDSARAVLIQLQPDIAYGPRSAAQTRAAVVGLSFCGLRKLDPLSATRNMLPAAFKQGMADPSRARMLGDFDLPASANAQEGDEQMMMRPSLRQWGTSSDPEKAEDAVILLYETDEQRLGEWIDDLQARAGELGFELVHLQRLAPTGPAGRCPSAHGGGCSVANVLDARDGISQPIIRGLDGSRDPANAIHVVEPGEIVLGYRDNLRQRLVEPADGGESDLSNGSFLVVRQLQFDRSGFDRFIASEARRLLSRPKLEASKDAGVCERLDDELRRMQQRLSAKMLGRWPSGASLVRAPEVRAPDADPGPVKVDNDFLYGQEDPAGMRCPLGSHVRRMNPRDSFDPGSRTQLAISNRHRILRVGRRYVVTRPDSKKVRAEGLMFMCLNADIERQFEFLQQTWALGAGFHGLDGEVDPLLGPGGRRQGFAMPHESGPVHLYQLPRFVQLIGGGYFLVPGKDFYVKLCGLGGQAATTSAPPPPAPPASE